MPFHTTNTRLCTSNNSVLVEHSTSKSDTVGVQFHSVPLDFCKLTTGNEVWGHSESHKVLIIDMTSVCPEAGAMLGLPALELTVSGPAATTTCLVLVNDIGCVAYTWTVYIAHIVCTKLYMVRIHSEGAVLRPCCHTKMFQNMCECNHETRMHKPHHTHQCITIVMIIWTEVNPTHYSSQ